MSEITVTRSEMRALFRQIARLLAAMSMDELRIIDDPPGSDIHQVAKSIDKLFATRGPDYKPTIREQRLKDNVLAAVGVPSEDGHRRAHPKQVHRIDNGARVVYVLKKNIKVNLKELPPSGQKIVACLTSEKSASIRTIMKETGLQRSTVANNLAVLRDHDIAESVPVDHHSNN